jgi:hypothetical protein
MTHTALTERLLDRLGPPKWFWIVIWGLTAMVRPIVFVATLALSGSAARTPDMVEVLTSQAAIGYVVVVLLWGVGRLERGAEELRAGIRKLTDTDRATDPFRGIGGVAGPITLSAVVVLIWEASAWIAGAYTPLVALADAPLLFLNMLPILTFVWVYLAILMGLNRLGRHRLALDPFPQDRSLGLGPLGSLASTGLVLLFAAAVPVLLVESDEPFTLIVSLLIVATSVLVFFLSMWRIHGQMVEAKARYVAIARGLYEDAYKPLRAEPTVERLEAQATALRAAQALDERAASLLVWPIDEGTVRFIAVVITGVVTSLVIRAIFAAAGI